MLKNFKKLFTYNWSRAFLKRLLPSNNKIAVSADVAKNITRGAVTLIVVDIIGCLINVYTTFFSRQNGIAITSETINISIQITPETISKFGNAFGPILVAVIIGLVMHYLTSANLRRSLPYFVLLIICALGVIISITATIYYLIIFSRHPILTSLNLLCIIMLFMAFIRIAVGCIDFCLEANE